MHDDGIHGQTGRPVRHGHGHDWARHYAARRPAVACLLVLICRNISTSTTLRGSSSVVSCLWARLALQGPPQHPTIAEVDRGRRGVAGHGGEGYRRGIGPERPDVALTAVVVKVPRMDVRSSRRERGGARRGYDTSSPWWGGRPAAQAVEVSRGSGGGAARRWRGQGGAAAQAVERPMRSGDDVVGGAGGWRKGRKRGAGGDNVGCGWGSGKERIWMDGSLIYLGFDWCKVYTGRYRAGPLIVSCPCLHSGAGPVCIHGYSVEYPLFLQRKIHTYSVF
jgi:hypothetical protein